jgi:hypothetical protein
LYLIFIGTRIYYDNDGLEEDGLPEDCIEITLFKALLEVHFPRHRVQRFTHMADCHNMYQTLKPSDSKAATDKQLTACTSVVQKSHIDYSQLMSSILNLDGKCKRESIFWELPLSFVIGIDDDCSLLFHSSLNDALRENQHKAVFSIRGKNFNQKLEQKYPMTPIIIKPGQIVMFAGKKKCYSFSGFYLFFFW